MTIKLHNSFSQKIVALETVEEKKTLSIYGCGVTVYDDCHLGHGRVFIIYDTLVRFLKEVGYDVRFARNITDIDDKIINKAQENNENINDLTLRYTQSMHQDIATLNCLPLTDEPKATESIDKMIEMIEVLIEKKHAYVLSSGEVLFSIESFSNYGLLSGQSLEDLHHGARVSESQGKRSSGDFTLWKPSKLGEPSWPSPWCAGRPGWHIECSAMIADLFKESLDIHLGGADLKFPHHENEIAQSECCFDRPLSKIWMHIGFVQVKNEKMSKSLGNFATLKDIFKKFDGNTLRLFYLMTHYRQPISFSEQALEQAESNYKSLLKAFKVLEEIKVEKFTPIKDLYQRLLQSLKEDLNTPAMFALIFSLLKDLKMPRSDFDKQKLSTIKYFCEKVLGLTFVTESQAETAPDFVRELAKKRQEYRVQKLWQLSDQYREKIIQQGWEVVDLKEGFSLRKL